MISQKYVEKPCKMFSVGNLIFCAHHVWQMHLGWVPPSVQVDEVAKGIKVTSLNAKKSGIKTNSVQQTR